MAVAGAFDVPEMVPFDDAVGASDGLEMALPRAVARALDEVEMTLFENAASASGGKVLLNAMASAHGEEVMHLDRGSLQGEYSV